MWYILYITGPCNVMQAFMLCKDLMLSQVSRRLWNFRAITTILTPTLASSVLGEKIKITRLTFYRSKPLVNMMRNLNISFMATLSQNRLSSVESTPRPYLGNCFFWERSALEFLKSSVKWPPRTMQLTLYMIFEVINMICTLQWHQNGRDGVSNHQPHDCLLKRLFGRRKKERKKTSKLRVTGLCAGNSPMNGDFPGQRANNKMFPFDDVIISMICEPTNNDMFHMNEST